LPCFTRKFLDALNTKLKLPRSYFKFIDRYDESKWAILQHYGYPTPLLDITKSIRLAASFATMKYFANCREVNVNEHPGFVYVLGLPEAHGYISSFTYEAVVLVRLLGTCPPEAKRPHLQDGYLIGTIPHEKSLRKQKNFRNCIVSKIQIENPNKFWTDLIKPMDISEIYPEDDKLEEIAMSLKDDFISLCEENGLLITPIKKGN